ncbi:AAA family ATPase [Alcaligenes endophyticus]|uniref:MoxR family ATPase n=1 Tax=Alcaligenes endophyticus TaxID=1929088 RepID=A0ABT8EJ58_9BURK|nr:MoxR family ATPase [Alcaligenes endophyticus]MCX5591643.1 MoxR family ATPase [Alcaligenes endophyticus]MDN4121321.1 MoxR family ATPase [Alcaligenes endophyticus]
MVATSTTSLDQLALWRQQALSMEQQLNQLVLGQEHVVRLLCIAIFARGHVLLEGDVGLGKTLLLRAMAKVLGGAYSRVEGTIDLMPADLVYYTYLDEAGKPAVKPGPLLQQGEQLSVFFFNEINRARPQVHALLLRLMAERSLSAFNQDYFFPHLQVFADRNQVEKEETFELPAAARDRFFMEVRVEPPQEPEIRKQLIFNSRFHDVDALIHSLPNSGIDFSQLGRIAEQIQQHVVASPLLEDYVLRLWEAIRYPERVGIVLAGINMDELIMGGASPRGMAMLVRAAKVRAWLEGRNILLPDDIRAVFYETVAHRVFLNPFYSMQQDTLLPSLCKTIFQHIPTP